jgi:hypothetical protein
MLTKPSRRGTGRLVAVVAVLVSLSGVARAQQSGLFPLHPIKRERVPCPLEDPVYKLYRSQYYGYYPTQWRPFPQGWNLPSPEGPNTQDALKKQPIEASTQPQPEEEGDQGPAPPDRGNRPAPVPPAENERSPFEMDTRPNNGGAAVPGAGGATRRPATPRAAEPSPFDIPAPDGGNPAAPRPRATQPTRPTPGSGTPDLAPPGPVPDAPPPQTSRNDEAADRDAGPLLAMPDASLPTVEEANGPGSMPTLTPATNPAVAATDPPATFPAQAQPSRRSRLGSFFAGLGLNRVRR